MFRNGRPPKPSIKRRHRPPHTKNLRHHRRPYRQKARPIPAFAAWNKTSPIRNDLLSSDTVGLPWATRSPESHPNPGRKPTEAPARVTRMGDRTSPTAPAKTPVAPPE